LTKEEIRLLREVELIVSKQPEQKQAEQAKAASHRALLVRLSDVMAI
jgi:hypothetical protein